VNAGSFEGVEDVLSQKENPRPERFIAAISAVENLNFATKSPRHEEHLLNFLHF
jgi:hypothetical protein